MKELILIRHAKSSWEHPVPDKERPLTDKGKLRAKKTATKLLNNLSYTPQYWITSPATRAYETAKIFVEIFNPNVDLITKEDLYTFIHQNVKKIIHNLPDNIQTAVMFGHNEAFTETVNILGDKEIYNLPTSGVAWIAFNVKHWKDIQKGTTKLIIIPKEL